ncbi:hypothetical protein [Azospirillum sp. A23]|uniref:hypothetical protein n=1 Tax=Azospirillum sp. A23 TaxID=3160608 RepID=UPI0036F389EB
MEQGADDLAAVSAFLAMAVKERLRLNGHAATDVWAAWVRLLDLSPADQSELLCRLLGEVPE